MNSIMPHAFFEIHCLESVSLSSLLTAVRLSVALSRHVHDLQQPQLIHCVHACRQTKAVASLLRQDPSCPSKRTRPSRSVHCGTAPFRHTIERTVRKSLRLPTGKTKSQQHRTVYQVFPQVVAFHLCRNLLAGRSDKYFPSRRVKIFGTNKCSEVANFLHLHTQETGNSAKRQLLGSSRLVAGGKSVVHVTPPFRVISSHSKQREGLAIEYNTLIQDQSGHFQWPLGFKYGPKSKAIITKLCKLVPHQMVKHGYTVDKELLANSK